MKRSAYSIFNDLATAMFATLIVYTLSIGPVGVLAQKRLLSQATFVKLYTPVIFVGQRVEPARAVLRDYMDWWRVRA